MGKPNTVGSASKLISAITQVSANAENPEIKVDSESISTYNYEVKTVQIQSVFDARLEYTGQTSGKQYRWNKAGDIQTVNAEDSQTLLAKRIGGNGCCGNSQGGNVVFVLFTGGK